MSRSSVYISRRAARAVVLLQVSRDTRVAGCSVSLQYTLLSLCVVEEGICERSRAHCPACPLRGYRHGSPSVLTVTRAEVSTTTYHRTHQDICITICILHIIYYAS